MGRKIKIDSQVIHTHTWKWAIASAFRVTQNFVYVRESEICTQSVADLWTAPHCQGAQHPSSDGRTPFHVLSKVLTSTSNIQTFNKQINMKDFNRLKKVIRVWLSQQSHNQTISALICFIRTWWLVSISSIRTPSLGLKLWWIGVCCCLLEHGRFLF